MIDAQFIITKLFKIYYTDVKYKSIYGIFGANVF
jgi:hypothetical protein